MKTVLLLLQENQDDGPIGLSAKANRKQKHNNKATQRHNKASKGSKQAARRQQKGNKATLRREPPRASEDRIRAAARQR